MDWRYQDDLRVSDALERLNHIGMKASDLTGERRAIVIEALRISCDAGNGEAWEWLRDVLNDTLPPSTPPPTGAKSWQ